MMTAASIGAGQAAGYSAYLESRTVASARGDYYLSPEGEPIEAPGFWHARARTLHRLGIEPGAPVTATQLVALMEGRDPQSGQFVRAAGSDGRRAAGIDLTFSAPKSVSVLWAIGSLQQRQGIEAAHSRAVVRAVEHVRSQIPIVRRCAGGQLAELASDVIAAEYRHTTARGVADGDLPDPQLHSHVLVTGVVREDGQIVAVASRPIFRSARELGAFYRSALAEELRDRGYGIDAETGKDARYFELHGVPDEVREVLSGRSREVWLAAERFRARHGRAPRRGELRDIKLQNRRAKTPQTRADLDRAWRAVTAEHGLQRSQATRLQLIGERGALHRKNTHSLEQRLEVALSAHGATFHESELRATILEQTAGSDAPEHASAHLASLLASGRVIALDQGRMTTAFLREAERAIERRVAELAGSRGAEVDERAREQALAQVSERIGELSAEQRRAVELLGAEQRVAIVVGEAGVGKGVVVDAAARAEQLCGREPIGIAVAGATAERLGHDSPSLQGATMTLDALIARSAAESVQLGERTTVFFDEAAMADTDRLRRLTELIATRDAKLVLIGDARQLPAIGAGGMFARIAEHAQVARLSEVRRTGDARERQAWSELRAGRPDRAMAHYRDRGQLHFADTREQAVEQAVRQWAGLTRRLEPREVALMSDASNAEIDRLNARAQQLRAERGELGAEELGLPSISYGVRSGDRVAFVAQHRPAGQERVENGTRGEVIDLAVDDQRVTVRIDGSGREVILEGDELKTLRLCYAQHLYRQQGATVERAVVVTGGWQASREGAYVEASRARNGTDWHLAREDLGTDGVDADRIERLAEAMRAQRATPCSIEFEERELSADLAHELERATERALERDKERDMGRERDEGPDLGIDI